MRGKGYFQSGLRILMYHSISEVQNAITVHPTQFAAQMDYLAQNSFRVVSLQEACRLLQAKNDLHRTIVLTFDDGYRDFLTTAAPVLQQHGFTATLFVVTGLVGKTSTWSSFDKTQPLLSANELQHIKSMGFALGSHTVTHADLTTLYDDALMRELNESRATFAYPGGRFTRRERDAVMRAGYECAVIVGGRWGNGAATDRFLLKREPVLGSDSLDWFAKRVNGFYEWHYLWAHARGIETR